MGRDITDVLDLLAIARAKLSAARLQRPTPYIDKTIYTNWNALCVSAYLHYARVTATTGCASVCAALARSHSRRGMGRRSRLVARYRLQ